MPALARISEKFFTSLITRLGIKPPFANGFELSNIVQPVSLVDADIPINAIASALTMKTAFSAGELTAPAAGTILADTGAQAFGDYNFLLILTCNELNRFRLKRRNAANTADIWSQILQTGQNPSDAAGLPLIIFSGRAHLEASERLRVETIDASNPGKVYQASLWIE